MWSDCFSLFISLLLSHSLPVSRAWDLRRADSMPWSVVISCVVTPDFSRKLRTIPRLTCSIHLMHARVCVCVCARARVCACVMGPCTEKEREQSEPASEREKEEGERRREPNTSKNKLEKVGECQIKAKSNETQRQRHRHRATTRKESDRHTHTTHTNNLSHMLPLIHHHLLTIPPHPEFLPQPFNKMQNSGPGGSAPSPPPPNSPFLSVNLEALPCWRSV